jgi:hypothetical protein
MTYTKLLEISSHWAAIATAVVAVFAYGRYVYECYQKRRKLEEHLKEEKSMGVDQGQRTVLHLMAQLRMTEAEVFDAAFRSKHIRPANSVDWQGRADAILFEYDH